MEKNGPPENAEFPPPYESVAPTAPPIQPVHPYAVTQQNYPAAPNVYPGSQQAFSPQPQYQPNVPYTQQQGQLYTSQGYNPNVQQPVGGYYTNQQLHPNPAVPGPTVVTVGGTQIQGPPAPAGPVVCQQKTAQDYIAESRQFDTNNRMRNCLLVIGCVILTVVVVVIYFIFGVNKLEIDD